MPRAERRAVRRRIASAGGPKDDVVVVQVPERRAPGRRASPPVPRENPGRREHGPHELRHRTRRLDGDPGDRRRRARHRTHSDLKQSARTQPGHVRRPACAFERLIPFSCIGRGFCPSCGGRRMTALAANLVDKVFPQVPVRQWVLTVPHRVRYLLAWDHTLCRAVLAVFIRGVLAFYRRRSRRPQRHRHGHTTAPRHHPDARPPAPRPPRLRRRRGGFDRYCRRSPRRGLAGARGAHLRRRPGPHRIRPPGRHPVHVTAVRTDIRNSPNGRARDQSSSGCSILCWIRSSPRAT
jgi:hypothetical protein